jgi:hypothetical protein
MNETRQQQMLAGQTALARKVFQVVPIQQHWAALEIHRALQASKPAALNSRQFAPALAH